MKKFLLTSMFILFFIQVSFAQITIDSSDFASAGDQVIMISDTVVSGMAITPGSASPQAWDYSALELDNVDTMYFMDVANSPDPGMFPTSNLVMNLVDTWFYLIKTDADLSLLGINGDIFGQGIPVSLAFGSALKQAEFPSTLGTTFTSTVMIDTVVEDNFSPGGLFDSLHLKRTIIFTSTIDAWGELTLQTRTDSVIRKFDIEVSVDSVWGKVGGVWTGPVLTDSTTKYYYRFLAKNADYFVLEAEATGPEGDIAAALFQAGQDVFAGVDSYTEPLCYGDPSGSITLITVGGTAPYSYAWSDGQTGQTATGLAGGTYSCTVSDNAGSQYVVSFTLNQPDSIDIAVDQITPDDGTNTGAIDLTVTGGTSPFTFAWSNGAATEDISGLAAGNYTITVTDGNGCTKSETFYVYPVGIEPVESSGSVRVFPNPATDYLTINLLQNTPVELRLYDLNGRLVLTDRVNRDSRIDLNGLKPGQYILILDIEGTRYSTKISLTN